MRFDPEQSLTAADIVNTYPADELARIISTYGEEPRARLIARAIVQRRPLRTSRQLAQTVALALGGRRGSIHPATRMFQALRIAVNNELENLEKGLAQALAILRPGGRLVTIAYHSLEDRTVKETFRREARDCICPPKVPQCICGHKASLKILSRKVITPSLKEIQNNPRSRSARLRVAERP
jgi:16S rRNA (cytosine1402-N4)-methyltransferase